MSRLLLRIVLAAAVFCCGTALFAQNLPETTIEWTSELSPDGSEVVLRGKTAVPLDQVHGTVEWISCVGEACHSPEEAEFNVAVDAGSGVVPPSDVSLPLDPTSPQSCEVPPLTTPRVARSSEGTTPETGSTWALIIEAILWGFAMLLTPCVFPMVPMTVSFFIKGEGKAGRFKALMYGAFIVLLYTVPICIIIGLTWILGGSAVTADIFNWLATHWLPNIVFFIVFMVFAASFFGAFEIVLPSKLVNSSDRKSDRGGLGGVFFMALTLVLVSFSCTGPIVGTVLIKSTAGEFWAPMVTMLAFSIAFALPFTLLAFFPSLLKSLPKSGGWLNSVKVTLGFIEVALGLKFLSVADQTYHWGILDREVYLAIWIVCFTLLGFYLLGKIRFKYDDKLEHIGLTRLTLAIAVFSFVVYMVPGMFGAPLKALSGYLPPLETQDFVVWNTADAQGSLPENRATLVPSPEIGEFPGAPVVRGGKDVGSSGSETFSGGAPAAAALIKMPQGLMAFATVEDALAAAKADGRKVFVDITGHGCVNCREMEARVWSDPAVLERLKQFHIVALYTDDKAKLPKEQWLATPEGKVLKDVGRVNSYIARTRFGVNAQPNYFILDASGNILAGPYSYNLSVPEFLEFLSLSE